MMQEPTAEGSHDGTLTVECLYGCGSAQVVPVAGHDGKLVDAVQSSLLVHDNDLNQNVIVGVHVGFMITILLIFLVGLSFEILKRLDKLVNK